MSVESAKACIERIKTDEDFAKKVIKCKDAEARMAFVRAAGYEFTTEDLRPLVGEIQDDELDAFVGGRLCQHHHGCNHQGEVGWITIG